MLNYRRVLLFTHQLPEFGFSRRLGPTVLIPLRVTLSVPTVKATRRLETPCCPESFQGTAWSKDCGAMCPPSTGDGSKLILAYFLGMSIHLPAIFAWDNYQHFIHSLGQRSKLVRNYMDFSMTEPPRFDLEWMAVLVVSVFSWINPSLADKESCFLVCLPWRRSVCGEDMASSKLTTLKVWEMSWEPLETSCSKRSKHSTHWKWDFSWDLTNTKWWYNRDRMGIYWNMG